jgi:hypothetical protein
MCHPLALADYCGGARGCAGRMATAQSELPAASKRERAAIACTRSPRDSGWSTWQCHFEVSVYATEGELLARIMARLLECIVGELTIVVVIMLNFYAVLGGEGLKGAFGGDGFD